MAHERARGHFHTCPARIRPQNDCHCEKKRYLYMFGVGFGLLLIEVAAGVASGSLAIFADAAHLFTDIASDGVAYIVASLVLSSNWSKAKTRAIGGLVQAVLLALMGWFILGESLARIENPAAVNPVIMIVVGHIAAAGNWWRHAILHSGKHSKQKHVQYWGQLFHVATDFGYSVAVAVGGVAILLTKNYSIDPFLSLGMVAVAWFLAVVTVVLSIREARMQKQ